MSTNPSGGWMPVSTRKTFLVVGLLALSLALSAVLAGPASATAQPNLGFLERDGSERFQVMGPSWSVRNDLAVTTMETIRVNVTSLTVDVQGNAGGGGAMDLVVQRYDGSAVRTFSFTQVASGPARYAAAVDLSALSLPPDWYYLRIFIDDTASTFEAMSAIKVGTGAAVHEIETYTDDTFAHPSDVFTTASTIWVRVVGDAGEDPDRWDLTEFVDGNSRVNGPNTNFDNFARNGNVYTFSIDLSRWPGAFPTWWSYTLSARLTGGAFDAGKQIQVYDPGLLITATDIAPTTARQGQTDVPMLALDFSLPSNLGDNFGPAAFNLERLRIIRTGAPGTNADVTGVRIWDDVNGNAALDAGDVLVASRIALGGVPFPAWVGQNGVTMTTVESTGPRHLLVTYDIAPTATADDFAGARINGFADVDMAGHFMSIGGLPAQSTNARILAADVLTVTNDPGRAPAVAPQGQAGVAVDLLVFTTNGAAMTVAELSLDSIGSGGATDVRSVYLRTDNGDGMYDPATDPALGTPAVFPNTGPAVFRNLGLAVNAGGRSVWVVFDLSATATVGATIGSRVASNASVIATGGSVFGGNFPLDSGLITVRGPLLTIAATDIAPVQAALAQSNVPMLRLDLTVDFGQTTVQGIRVDKGGSSPVDTDIAAVKLYRDADGNGAWSSADVLLDSTIFVGGTATFAPLNVVVGQAQTVRLFILLDVAATATVGTTLRMELADETYLVVDAASTVDPVPFPIRSSDVTIIAQPLGTISGTVSDSAGNPIAGATVEVAQLGLVTTTNALGAYSFANVPMGTYYVIARHTGYVDGNQTVTLTTANPMKVVNFTLTPISTGGVDSILLYIGAGLAALLVLGGLLFLVVRRKDRCPVCGKPKPRDRAVCGECEAKGLRPPAANPPPPPPSS